jgi:adhesin/invasin
MRLTARLLPVAGLIAFVVLAGFGTHRADANAGSVTAQATGNGTTITVSATYSNNPAGGTAMLMASGAGGFSTATATGGAGVTVGAFQPGSAQVITTPDTSGNPADMITISATFTCAAAGQVSFTLTQAGGTPASASSSAMTCGGTGAQLGPTPFTGYGQQQQYPGYPNGQYPGYPNQQYPNGQFPAGYNPQQYPNGVMPNVAALQQQQQQTLANNSAGSSSNLTSIVASPSSVTCGGTSNLTINAKTANGSPAPDGTSVSLYSSTGSLDPKVGATKGGTFSTTFKAPTSAGTATIIASVAGNAGSSDLTITCAGGVPATSSTANTSSTPGTGPTGPAISSPPPPPITSAQSDPSLSSGGVPVLRPPSTGDAGLLSRYEDDNIEP